MTGYTLLHTVFKLQDDAHLRGAKMQPLLAAVCDFACFIVRPVASIPFLMSTF